MREVLEGGLGVEGYEEGLRELRDALDVGVREAWQSSDVISSDVSLGNLG